MQGILVFSESTNNSWAILSFVYPPSMNTFIEPDIFYLVLSPLLVFRSEMLAQDRLSTAITIVHAVLSNYLYEKQFLNKNYFSIKRFKSNNNLILINLSSVNEFYHNFEYYVWRFSDFIVEYLA